MPVLAEWDEMPGMGDGIGPRGLSFSGPRTSDLHLMHRWLDAPMKLSRRGFEGGGFG